MTPAQLELVTAAVDGEMTPVEQRAFRSLLASSAEARGLFERLSADRDRLRRALPAAVPPPDLRARVLARIADAAPAPLVEPARRPAAARRQGWATVAVAASLLIAVAAVSYRVFVPAPPAQQLARQGGAADPSPREHGVPNSAPAPQHERTDHAPRPAPPVVPPPREVLGPAVALAPEPRAVSPDLIGSPLLPKLPPFDRVDVRVPLLRPVADLGRDDVGQELLDELRRDPAYRLDLFVRETARGVDVFQNAARAAGLTVFADAATVERLKKRQVHAAVFYTEALTAAELAELLSRLPAEDAKFSPRVCDALHVTAAARADELDLKAILGMDVGLYKRPAAGPTAVPTPAPSKSLNSETIDSVVKSVSGSAVKGDKPAVLLTWQAAPTGGPRANPSASAELKQYLQKRGDRKPNAVPAVIVIRPAG